MTEFFVSIAEKWYQLAFHSTTTCLLSDSSFRQEIRALSTTECCWAHLLCLPCSERDWRVATPFAIQVLLNKKFYRTQRTFFFLAFEWRIRCFMSRNKSIRCGSRAWPNFGLMSFSSIIYLLLCRKRQNKVVAHLAQCMLVNTKTRAYGLTHNILFSRRLCIKFFRAIIKIVSTRVSLEIDDIIGSHVYTAA